MNLLLTGANGFLGSKLAVTLNAEPYVRLTAAVRRSVQLSAMNVVEVQGLDANTDWADSVSDQQVVIHTAALLSEIPAEVSSSAG